MSTYRFSRRSLAAALALAVVACSDTSAPESPLSDPPGTSADLTRLSQPFETSVFESFAALSVSAGPLASASQAATLALAARPYSPQGAAAPTAETTSRAAALRRLVPRTSIQAVRDSFLPDTAKGTWEWDVATDQYVKTGPAPAPNTIRIILYVTDPNTLLPVEPVDQLGYADIKDNKPATGFSVSLTVKDSAETTTYLDYTATLTPGPNNFSANATGVVTNGLQGALRVELNFSTTFSASQTIAGSDTTIDLSADATVSLNQSVTAVVNDDARIVVDPDTVTLDVTRDFRFQRPGEVITVVGTIDVTFDRATEESTGTFNLTITVSGETLARIQGTTVTGPGGRELTELEVQVVNQVLFGADQIFAAIAAFFQPIEEFFLN